MKWGQPASKSRDRAMGPVVGTRRRVDSSEFSLVSMATRRVGARLKPCSLPSISPVPYVLLCCPELRAKASIYTYGAGVLCNMTSNRNPALMERRNSAASIASVLSLDAR